MHVDAIGHFVACELEHGGPEQRVEVDNILADEMNLFGVIGRQKFFKRTCFAPGFGLAAVEIIFQAGKVADRRIQPDVEVLARRVGDRNAEVGRVA